MLITIDNFLTKADVADFRAQLGRATWIDGAKTAGTFARQVKDNQQLEDGSEIAVALGNTILRKLGAHPLFISYALPSKIYPPKFNRYCDSGSYGAHVDSALMQVPGTNITLRGDLSATLFLSEPDEYEGGELEIESGEDTQLVKLEAGAMVVYTSGSMHRVAPVTKGVRIASFFWVESFVADESERALLFDLDLAIQNLTRAAPGESRSLLKMTQVYHNLLRRWATT